MTTLTLGTVRLTVSNVERLVNFYTTSLGLRLISQNAGSAQLGVGNTVLLDLIEDKTAKRYRRTTGLYHFAIRVPNRRALAEVLRQIIITKAPEQGYSDHGVSEALYLADPEGNGIEVYRDRPRDQWLFEGDKLAMVTRPIDLQNLIDEIRGDNGRWAGMPDGTDMGHIHLHVADTDEAEAFYINLLGFDLMQRYPGASFLAMDGYHHHIGANIWQGQGAPRPPRGALGLRDFRLNFHDHSRLDAALGRMRDAGVAFETSPDGTAVEDPSGNRIILSAVHTSTS